MGKYFADGQSAGDLFPHLLEEFHPTKNGSLSLFDVARVSGKRAYWICKVCSHEWETFIANRTKLGAGCTKCALKRTSEQKRGITPKPKTGKSLAEKAPHVAKYFDESKNGITTYDIGTGSEKMFWWLCERNHSLQSRIYSKISGYKDYGYFPCLTCYKEDKTKPKAGRSLGERFPEISKSWHPKKNGELTPFNVFASANIYVWWLCDKGHDTYALVNSKANGHPCGSCRSFNSSQIEDRFRKAFQEVLKGVSDEASKLDVQWRKRSRMEVDIFGYYKGKPVVVEYDGEHFHNNFDDVRNRDLAKTNALLDAGYMVVRIRERELYYLDIQHDSLYQLSHFYNRRFPDENISETVSKIIGWLGSKV